MATKRKTRIKKGIHNAVTNPGRVTYPNGTYIAPAQPSSAPSGALGGSAGMNPPPPKQKDDVYTPPTAYNQNVADYFAQPVAPTQTQNFIPVTGTKGGGTKYRPINATQAGVGHVMPNGYWQPATTQVGGGVEGAAVGVSTRNTANYGTDYAERMGMGTTPTSPKYSYLHFSPQMSASEVVSSVLSTGTMPQNLTPTARASLLADPRTKAELVNQIIADYVFDPTLNQYIMSPEAVKAQAASNKRPDWIYAGGAMKGSYLTFKTQQAYDTWERRHRRNNYQDEDPQGSATSMGAAMDYRGATG